MGTALAGGLVRDTPFNLGGGGLGHPLPSNLIVKPFSHCGAKRPKLFFGFFKSTQNPFRGTFELSNVKIFFDAHRKSGKNTLIDGPIR